MAKNWLCQWEEFAKRINGYIYTSVHFPTVGPRWRAGRPRRGSARTRPSFSWVRRASPSPAVSACWSRPAAAATSCAAGSVPNHWNPPWVRPRRSETTVNEKNSPRVNKTETSRSQILSYRVKPLEKKKFLINSQDTLATEAWGRKTKQDDTCACWRRKHSIDQPIRHSGRSA